MAESITTSIVINFVDPTGSDSPSISAEVDNRPAVEGGYNLGKSQFVYGDSPVFLLYKESDIEVIDIETTIGTITLIASDGIITDQKQIVSFTKQAEASLGKPITGTPVLTFLAGGAVEDGSIPSFTVSPSGKVTASKDCLAVVKVTYDVPFAAYRLTGIPADLEGEKAFPVIIVITAQRSAAT